VFDPPAVVGAHELVVDECFFVGIEHDVQAHVAVHVERHLPSLRRVLRQQGIEFDSGVVHHRVAARPEWDLGFLHGGGVQIRERRRDGAHPWGSVGPELDALLGQPRRVRRVDRHAGVGVDGHVVERNAQRGIRSGRERLVGLEHLGGVRHLRRRRDPEARHVLEPSRCRLQRAGHRILQGRHDGLDLRSRLVGDAVGRAVGVAAETRPGRIGRWLAVSPLVESDDGGVEVRGMARVVEDNCAPGGKVLVEVGVGGHLHLLQEAVETLEDDRLVGRQFSVDLVPQRLHITEVRVTHVRRDPVGRRLRQHPTEQRMTMCLDEAWHQDD